MRQTTRAKIVVILAVLCLALASRGEDRPDFSGTWKLSGERSLPPRKADVTLVILHRGPMLSVETTIVHGSETPRHAIQRYSVDGKTSVSTGADGDEFHTSIVWQDQSLVFTIVEHEDQRILDSKETWSLSENGSVLQRVRELPGGKNQILVYLRQP